MRINIVTGYFITLVCSLTGLNGWPDTLYFKRLDHLTLKGLMHFITIISYDMLL